MSERDDGVPSRDEQLADFQTRLGYRFRDRDLLVTALRHASRANEDGMPSNERLEFLGDAALGLAVAHTLYETHPDWAEGDLARAQAATVDGRSLAEAARKVDLGSCLDLGRSELQSAGATKDTILEDAFEAVLGAVYIEAGLSAVESLVRKIFPEISESTAPRVERDPKTELNELTIAMTGEPPRYELLDDSGVDDDDARFTIGVSVCGRERGQGTGRSKRAAQVAAARAALKAGVDDDG